MKRSQINKIIQDNISFIEGTGFVLPPFAKWTVSEWDAIGGEYDGVRNGRLGWDVSDYGSGDFHKKGIVALTIRIGNEKIDGFDKPYAEKLLILEPFQEIPLHFHPNKIEDLINRGGADFFIKLYNSNPDDSINTVPVNVFMDGRRFTVPSGEIIRVRPGESITLLPRQYHAFWSESGKTLFGEVTMTNNDHHFFDVEPGPTEIEEDEPLLFLRVADY